MLAQIASVDRQRGLTIEFKQHIVFTACDLARRAKRRPAAKRPVRESQPLAIQTDTRKAVAAGALIIQHPGLGEGTTIASETAGDGNVLTHHFDHASQHGASVDVNALSEYQDRPQAIPRQTGCQAPACRLRVLHRLQFGTDLFHAGLGQCQRRDHQRAVTHPGCGNFTGGRTADTVCLWKGCG